MQVKETTKQEIENKARGMSDFLRMEYFETCLKQTKSIEVKKFCHQELARLYEARNMFLEAAKNMNTMAEISITFNEKIKAYVKETELWIKAGRYENADASLKRALASANTQEKEEIKKAIKEFYKRQAEAYEKEKRNTNALKIYEKLFEIAEQGEKQEIKNKLIELYGRLGKIREYMKMKG